MSEYRHWTAKERDRLRARKPGETLVMLAALLGRTYRSVCAAVKRFSVERKKGWRLLEDSEDRYRRLHAAGYCDREAAARLGVSQATVLAFRVRLGLAANMHLRSERYLAERKRNYRAVMSEHLGCDDFGEFHRRRGEIAAAALGWWPHAANGPQARILEALSAGPLTTRQLYAALGLPYDPSGHLHGTTIRHVRTLVATGVIVRARQGMGNLLSLADGVRRRRPDDKAIHLDLPRREE